MTPVEKLKSLISNRQIQGAFAGSRCLSDAAALAYRCQSEANDKRRAVAYSLYHFLTAAAYDQDRELSNAEAVDFADRVGSAISRAISFLKYDGTEGAAISIIAEIARLEAAVLPRPDGN